MTIKPKTKMIDALSARTRFGEVMESAEKQNTRFLVSRRGKPKVVILSVEDYLRNILKKPDLLAEIQENSQKVGLDKMTDQEIMAEIRSARASQK
ncbi:MAG: type II toxin-antitoxin system Phd/YefM family antitoxin [Desulfobacteraceae bacterium]|nr:type II toxin-antitoxin system Phd/YefM family antitoxin [Desulfobacteraceae bacterium]MBC2755916.1 type II toxin-antitoxin system Phd/YefM family antitoxin [Desulfobacteraceae bacterium]